MSDEKMISRRGFLKDAAVVGAAAATAGMLGVTSAQAQTQSPWLPAKWDYEADVVIVGYGGAGVSAAIAAFDAGSKVLVLEKAPTADGGSSGVAGGNCRYPKPLTDFATYLKVLSYGTMTDDALATATATAIYATPDWIKKLGGKGCQEVPYVPSCPESLVTGLVSAGFTSNTRQAFIKADGSIASAGVDWIAFLQSCAESRKIPLMLATPVTELIQDPITKEILGVKALKGVTNTLVPPCYTGGTPIYVKASKAVILSCGGYENNAEIRDNVAGEQPHAYMTFYGTPYNTGDGVTMAQKVGAKTWHMRKVDVHALASKAASQEIGCGMVLPPAYGMPSAPKLPAIIVNRDGKRFMNEYFSSGHSERAQAWRDFDEELPAKLQNPLTTGGVDARDFCDYANIPFYMVFDSTMMKAGPLHAPLSYYTSTVTPHVGPLGHYVWSDDNSKELAKGWIIQADTIKELGSKIVCKDFFGRKVGMDAAGLDAAVTKYNSYCTAGKDLDFGRNAATLLALKTPPFYAIELCECQTNTDGGPVHNQYSQTVDLDGKTIPRLYSAGELGSIFGFLYYGGGNFPEALAMGRVAGAHAATLKPWGA